MTFAIDLLSVLWYVCNVKLNEKGFRMITLRVAQGKINQILKKSNYY